MLLIFYWILIVILHNIYLLLWYNDIEKLKEVNKTQFKYILDGETFEHSATIYKTGNPNSKKVIIILSGSFKFSFDIYLQKMVTDLLTIDYIKNKYQIIVYEKLDKQSFVCTKDVKKYIQHLNNEINIDELTLFGFSSGGVIASHVMSSLKTLSCKKKIITYDTPYQVMDNVLSYKKNTFYRPDYYFNSIIKKTYLQHYNYDEIKDHVNEYVKQDKWNNGATEFFQLIYKIHNLTQDEFYRLSGFNFDQDDKTQIIEIYCENDPIVDRQISDEYIKNNSKGKIIIRRCKKSIGHCSDMWSPGFNIISIAIILTS